MPGGFVGRTQQALSSIAERGAWGGAAKGRLIRYADGKLSIAYEGHAGRQGYYSINLEGRGGRGARLDRLRFVLRDSHIRPGYRDALGGRPDEAQSAVQFVELRRLGAADRWLVKTQQQIGTLGSGRDRLKDWEYRYQLMSSDGAMTELGTSKRLRVSVAGRRETLQDLERELVRSPTAAP